MRSARAALVGLAVATASALAAASAASPLYQYDRGSYSYDDRVPLVRSHADVFPEGLVDLLVDECRNTNRWEKNARDPNLKDSKAATNWASMEQIRNPRSAAEMAVAILYRFAFPDGKEPPGGIAGGEWWVQMRNSNENIGFHVDKDEGIASEEQWMKMPILSTVTYLTDVGGPTLVLNQSSNRGGNKQEPELPVRGLLVYPKKNRHMLFRGNLQHGVVGEFGQDIEGGAERITFLVNWWDKRPMAPYCMEVSDRVIDNHIRSRKLAAGDGDSEEDGSMLGWVGSMVWGSDSEATEKKTYSRDALWKNILEGLNTGTIGPASANSKREMPELVRIPTKASAQRHVDIRVPPRKRYNFLVPATAADGVTFARKVVEYDWRPEDVAGILHDLDPTSRMCMHLFENTPGVKVIVFRNGQDKAAAERFDLDVSYKVGRAFIESERFGGPTVYAANTRGHSRIVGMLRSTYGGSSRKTKVMIAAMIVGPNRRRTHYRMWHKKNKAPSVESIVAWVKRLERGDSETLKFDEVRSGRRRKRKGRKRRRRSRDDAL
eukprot:g2408.t1